MVKVTVWKIENNEPVPVETEEVGEFDGYPILRFVRMERRSFAQVP